MSAMNYLLFSTLVCLAIGSAVEFDYEECRIPTEIDEASLHKKLCELEHRVSIMEIRLEFGKFGTAPPFDTEVSTPPHMQKRKNEFIRFGKRKNEFIRFGRSNGGADDSQFVAKRKNEFIRFG
uniref:Short neuropeptide F n=1 Tax=Panagrellus redivivus TaxID=6233 RepID=A0A7E4W456_PANRE